MLAAGVRCYCHVDILVDILRCCSLFFCYVQFISAACCDLKWQNFTRPRTAVSIYETGVLETDVNGAYRCWRACGSLSIEAHLRVLTSVVVG